MRSLSRFERTVSIRNIYQRFVSNKIEYASADVELAINSTRGTNLGDEEAAGGERRRVEEREERDLHGHEDEVTAETEPDAVAVVLPLAPAEQMSAWTPWSSVASSSDVMWSTSAVVIWGE